MVQKPQASENILKFNNNLLLNDRFCNQVKTLYQRVTTLDMSDLNKWEWFRFRLKHLAIDTGKKISQVQRRKQKELIEKINKL